MKSYARIFPVTLVAFDIMIKQEREVEGEGEQKKCIYENQTVEISLVEYWEHRNDTHGYIVSLF